MNRIVPSPFKVELRIWKRLFSASIKLPFVKEKNRKKELQQEVKDCLKILFGFR